MTAGVAEHGARELRPRTRRARPIQRILLSPWSTGVGAVVMGLAFVLPPDGAGVPLCLFHSTTGLPCPGCGLTRSVSSIAQLRAWESVTYHPFGPIVLALCAFLVATLFLGRRRKLRLARWLARHDKTLRPVYLGTVAAFIAFGIVRLVVAAIAPSTATHL